MMVTLVKHEWHSVDSQWTFEITEDFLAEVYPDLTEDQINSLLRNFRDIMAQKEPELRKQTEKVDATFIKR